MNNSEIINVSCRKCQHDTIDKENKIYECISRIQFLLDNLKCVRISVRGNDEIIPSQELIDNALFSIIDSMEPLIKEIRELV